MTNTELFIQRAIEGGWQPLDTLEFKGEVDYDIQNEKYQIFLTTEVWQAVGKVEGWTIAHVTSSNPNDIDRTRAYPTWRGYMHGLIDALARGETIEDYLGSILNHD